MYKSLLADIGTLQETAGTGRPIGVVGFSMGGHWAVWLSQQPDTPIAATVLYYACRAGRFENSRSSFLAHFAEQDDWVSASGRRKMERQIAAADRPYACFDYPGTGHWFAETDRAGDYDAVAADLAFVRTVLHLRGVLH